LLRLDEKDELDFLEFSKIVSYILYAKFKNIKRKWPSDYTIEVFLGGACGMTTWRKNIAVPMLSTAGITFFDPQVEEWKPDMVVIESIVKERCAVLLFVIGSETRGVASMVEATQYICEGRDVVLVLSDISSGSQIDGDIITQNESKDLNRGRAYIADVARKWMIPTFSNVHDACHFIVELITQRKEEDYQESKT
jgi:hypothetical protein